MKIKIISQSDRKGIVKLWKRGFCRAYLSRKYKLAPGTISFITKEVEKGQISNEDYKICNGERLVFLKRRRKARIKKVEKAKWAKRPFKSYKDYVKEDKLRQEQKKESLEKEEIAQTKTRKKSKPKMISVWTKTKDRM